MPLTVEKKLPITGPRIVAALLTGFFLTVLSTTILNWWSVGEVKIQPIMVVVVWCGFNLSLNNHMAGGPVVMLLGYLGDSLSGGIVGLQVIVNTVVFCLCAIAQRRLDLEKWPYQMIAVGLMMLISPLIIIAGLMLVSQQHLTMPAGFITSLLWHALLSALLAPLFFMLLGSFSRFLQKLWPAPQRGKIDG